MAESLEAAAKIVAYLAILVATGVAGAGWLLRRSAIDSSSAAAARQRLDATLLPAGVCLLVATLARAWAHTASAFGFADAWSIENLQLIALESRWGGGWRLQALSALSVVVMGAALRMGPRPWSRWMAGVAAIAAAFAVPQTGHGAAEPYRWVLHGAHVAGAGLWAGTLLALLTLRSPAPDAQRPLLRAFAPLAAAAVAVIAVSGLVASWVYVGAWTNLWGSEYGLVLVLKLGLVAAMAASGGINWLRLHRHADRDVSRTVLIEAVLAVAVVVVTGWLTETAHP